MSELQAVRDELERERNSHEETSKKLSAAEKEAKASTLMNLELEDYQRSIESLEGELANRDSQLETARKEGSSREENLQRLMGEIGES